MSVIKKDTAILRNFINGEWVNSKSVQVLYVLNPATNELLTMVPQLPDSIMC
ncbi:hypothetical protein V7103_07710 [Neobacillus drentensis]|jgi:malonate-semialdehyde dehydrogenase (acetylating)/methylmalonate-semialdehyde dehydrogenase|uniref:hypothetical protein n=1 Tax=Neobacillus drentensis TaxID=220684 RepID=UPI00159640B1